MFVEEVGQGLSPHKESGYSLDSLFLVLNYCFSHESVLKYIIAEILFGLTIKQLEINRFVLQQKFTKKKLLMSISSKSLILNTYFIVSFS